ncbi:hypothetical protein CANINC_001570 [Pichia inconspicua]|uniref:AAA+ ATPase domain-containing protein n=1 Tax=Pichia inconspicua TaxID=52247 RepID=A0A4T0X397_9ASCO|nr:hypothetical protein CANINC_001570 [[Candida] inconspicua]
MDKYSSRGRKGMIKSLRPGGGLVTPNNSVNTTTGSNTPNSVPTSPPVSNTPTAAAASAKHAANIIWAPSNSLNSPINDEEDYDFSDFSMLKINNSVPNIYDKQRAEERTRAALKASKMVHYPNRRINQPSNQHLHQHHQQHHQHRNNQTSKYSSNKNGQHNYSYSNSPVRSLDSPTQSPVRGISNGYIPDVSEVAHDKNQIGNASKKDGIEGIGGETTGECKGEGEGEEEEDEDEALLKKIKGVDLKFARNILTESNRDQDKVYWDDIAGLDQAKETLMETIVYPFLRPDLFKGLREPVSGMLLFGPPGTGKTMLARAAATESNSTFFSMQASSLTSKWYGESEKLVRALFQVAKAKAPSIIFVDEIDSLLSKRSGDGDDDTSRRLKNEFLVQWSELSKAAAGRDSDEPTPRVLVLAATNLPWGIDEAARRRFVRRQYIPLPEDTTREAHFRKLLEHTRHSLTDSDMKELVKLTEGYSGSDITSLAKDAAIWPIREVGSKMLSLKELEIRPISLDDFKRSMRNIRPSVNKEGLAKFEDWAREFGSSGA